MNPGRIWAAAGLVVAAVTAPVSIARAELYKDVVTGLNLFDVRLSGEQNLLGDGFTINGNAFYNNRRFNFGFADLTLTGALQGSVGFTRRGIPAGEFTLNTGGSPLSYKFNLNNGIQDLTATGSALIDINTHINALGFYDQTFQISNRGTFETDGFGVIDKGTLAFDVGPINVSGNIFTDMLAMLTEPLFAATGTSNPFAKFSGRATKAAELNKTADELRARIDAGEVLSDEEIATLVNNTILAAMLGGQPTDHLFDNFVLPPDVLKEALADKAALSELSLQPVPEPAMAGLIALSMLVWRPWRRPR